MVGMYSVHIPFKITISRYVRASYRRHIERDFQTVSKYNEKNKVDVLFRNQAECLNSTKKKYPQTQGEDRPPKRLKENIRKTLRPLTSCNNPLFTTYIKSLQRRAPIMTVAAAKKLA